MDKQPTDNSTQVPDAVQDYHRFNMEGLDESAIDELIGACKRGPAYNRLTGDETRSLEEWITRNREFRDLYPVSILYKRVREVLLDAFADNNEKTQLFSVLPEFKDFVPGFGKTDLSSSIPLDDPAPEVIIPDHNFCFAGDFVFGTQERCGAETAIRGGRVKKDVNFQVDFLVIGELSGTDWIHSSYVRKIAKAIEVRELIKGLWIVSEENWARALERTAPYTPDDLRQ